MRKRYTLLEWDRLSYGDEDGCIPIAYADELASLAARSVFAGRGQEGVLEHGRKAIRARGVVGIVASDRAALEILPKIDVASSDSVDIQNANIRKHLVHMLATVLRLKIDLGRISEIRWQNEHLLEILIGVFCDKLTDVLKKGMPRSYLNHEDDLPAIRGKLDVARQFTKHAVNPSLLACKFDDLSSDTPLNRIVKAAVTFLGDVSQSRVNQQKLRELAFAYSDISEVQPSAIHWDAVILDWTNEAWGEVLAMARMLLRSQYQTTTFGGGSGTALLFEMNMLFEEYVGRLITKALGGSEFSVKLQSGRKYCLVSQESGKRLFLTKPDILIFRGDELVHVIDTKWKRISRRIDDEKQGVSQADVYQMMAYGHIYRSPRLTLLYPHHAGLRCSDGVLATHQVADTATSFHTATIDLSTRENILERLRKIVIA